MTLSSRDQLCVKEKAGALQVEPSPSSLSNSGCEAHEGQSFASFFQAGELLGALQNCFSGLDKAATRVSQEPDCAAAQVAHDTWACSWVCVMERAAELIAIEHFPQQASTWTSCSHDEAASSFSNLAKPLTSPHVYGSRVSQACFSHLNVSQHIGIMLQYEICVCLRRYCR